MDQLRIGAGPRHGLVKVFVLGDRRGERSPVEAVELALVPPGECRRAGLGASQVVRQLRGLRTGIEIRKIPFGQHA